MIITAHPNFKKFLLGFLLYIAIITGINVSLTSLKPEDLRILQYVYGLEFALFTFIGLATFSRYRPGNYYLPLWRILILVLGGGLAYFSLMGLGYNNLSSEMIFPIWSFALIGLSLVALLTRYVPEKFFKVWLGMEKVVVPLRPNADATQQPQQEVPANEQAK